MQQATTREEQFDLAAIVADLNVFSLVLKMIGEVGYPES